MKSTEEAWMQFSKSDNEVIPIKDVSLEGKLDTIAAQLNKIEVDSSRVAATVPEILGDKGVEEALKEEEGDVPELPDEKEDEESSEEEPQEEDGEAEKAETVGNPDNPEGIFTDDPEAEEKSEEAPAEEAPVEDADAKEIEPVADDSPAGTATGEDVPGAEPAPEAPAEEAVGEEGEPAEKEAEAEADAEPEADEEPVAEKDDEPVAEEDVPEEEEAEAEPEVVETEDGEKVVVVPKKKVVAKSAFMQIAKPSSHKGSAFMNVMKSVKKDDAPTETIQEEAGGVGAGSAGASNAVYGKIPSDATEAEGELSEVVDEHKACKSVFIQKYGTPGHTGVWQRSESARRNPDNACYAPNGPSKAKRHNWTDQEREDRDQKPRRVSNPGSGDSYRTHGGSPTKARRRAKQRYHEMHQDAKYRGKDGKMHDGGKHGQNLRSTTRDKPKARNKGDNWGGRTGVIAGATRNKGRDNVKGQSKTYRKKSFLDYVSGPAHVEKSAIAEQVKVQTSSVSTALPTQKHIPTMQEIYVSQRPATIATVNGDLTRTRLGEPFELNIQKSEPASLSPMDFLNTDSDWQKFYARKH